MTPGQPFLVFVQWYRHLSEFTQECDRKAKKAEYVAHSVFSGFLPFSPGGSPWLLGARRRMAQPPLRGGALPVVHTPYARIAWFYRTGIWPSKQQRVGAG